MLRETPIASAIPLALALWLAVPADAAALTAVVAGPERVLFDQATSACDASDLPDAPARAFRNADQEIVLFAPNFKNRAFVGPDFNTLTRDCKVRFAAAGSADPSLLDDRTWLQAFHSQDGRIVFALASASFIPYRHGKACAAGTGARTDCWLNGIAALRSDDGGATFHYLGTPPHHIAFPPPEPYRTDLADPPGFVSATNIVSWNGQLFTILWRRGGDDGERSRNCLARAANDDPLKWDIWSGGRFVSATRFEDQSWTVLTTNCDAIGPATPIRGIVFHEESQAFLAVFQYRRGERQGFYYATSRDLVSWSRPKPLLLVDLRNATELGEEWAQYPSIIDGSSSDRNFGSVGDAADLVFVRFKSIAGTAKVVRRLVAVPIRIDGHAE
jgi:hypothetical protein